MRVVVQRVKAASVSVNDELLSKINQGLLLLVGFTHTDNQKTLEYVARKVAKLRIFSDDSGQLNLDINQIKGEILSISQFTVYGDIKKSNRPSFTEARNYEDALILYREFNKILRNEYHLEVSEGQFGSEMDIALVNSGPVTIIIEKE
jgi:D-tyrosyl-tRNA(Tyr) deacylase